MKKGFVLLVIALLAGVGALRYMEARRIGKRAAGVEKPSAAEQQPEGVPLPDIAKEISAVSLGDNSDAPGSEGSGRGADKAAMERSGASLGPRTSGCGAGIKDMLSESVKRQMQSYPVVKALGQPRINELYAKAGRYQACLSLAAGEDLCQKSVKDKEMVNYQLRNACVSTLYPAGLSGFMYGKAPRVFCSAFFRYNLKGAETFISDGEFCDIARRGPAALSDNFCGRAPAEMRSKCLQIFPKTAERCKDETCSRIWAVNTALLSGDLAAAGPALSPLVAAFTRKTAAACQPLADSITQEYCSIKNTADQALLEERITRQQTDLDRSIKKQKQDNQ